MPKYSRRKSYARRSSAVPRGRVNFRGIGWSGYGLNRGGLRATGLMRSAIAARVHSFKRVCQPFGIQSGLAGSVTPVLVGVSGSNAQLAISAPFASTFVQGTANFGGALQFMLSHISNSAEITSLFDNYRIKMVKIDVILTYNSGDATLTTAAGAAQQYRTGVLPTMHYTVDYDDATAPTNIVSVMENSYTTSRRMDKPFSIVIKPRAQQSIIGGTASAGGILPANTWLDNSATAIPHYGLKFWIEDWPVSEVAGTYAVKFIPTYYIEAKNVV